MFAEENLAGQAAVAFNSVQSKPDLSINFYTDYHKLLPLQALL